MAAAFIATIAAYWPGLHGGFLFDDYPNIVDNQGVQPHDTGLGALVGAALSSPASEFKRPLASLSFAANYLTTGLDPYWMKLTNLIIHLLNGLMVFLLAKSLLREVNAPSISLSEDTWTERQTSRAGVIAALIAAGWMLLPINLTGVLYVVQRMESMANLFVLLGLTGYVAGRRRMLCLTTRTSDTMEVARGSLQSAGQSGFALCVASLILPAAIGILAKETAAMLPLYALLIEWIIFQFRGQAFNSRESADSEDLGRRVPGYPTARLVDQGAATEKIRRDWRIIGVFVLLLLLPMLLGLAWLLPGLLKPGSWATRDFTMSTRMLSEARIVADYVRWTLLPTPDALSFYHDDFHISRGLLTPWTTLASLMFLLALCGSVVWFRRRQPLFALGIAMFLGCQLLTGTILPLELIYEHRNYFASFGLLLAIVPPLTAPAPATFALPSRVLLAGLMTCWLALTAMTAYAWGDPLRLAGDLALRAPNSPRAQYELGRTYVIYSHYDPSSPFTRLAYAPLEKAATLPDASILAEQALIFMNSRMHLPLKSSWWDSMITKLRSRKSTVQDESSLAALTQCAREHHCDLPPNRMIEAFTAALSRPDPSARLLAIYGDYAWNVLDDHALGLRMIGEAVKTSPGESAYRISLVRMLSANGQKQQAQAELESLKKLNVGGSLDGSIGQLQRSL